VSRKGTAESLSPSRLYLITNYGESVSQQKLDGVVDEEVSFSLRQRLGRKSLVVAAAIVSLIIYTFHGSTGEPIRFIRKPW
jgi:hypothetical protein